MKFIVGVRRMLVRRRLALRARDLLSLATDPLATVYPEPIVIGTGEGEKVLVLSPHADDETFGAGGAIAAHIDAGHDVTVVVISDNAASVDDSAIPAEKITEVRRGEFRAAMEILGVRNAAMLDIRSDAFVPVRGNTPIHSVFIGKEPTIMYLPSLFDNHRDHRILNLWTAQELRAFPNLRPRIRAYEVWSPLPATHALDISDRIERKRRAIRCYSSQTAVIDYERHIFGLNTYRAMTFGTERVTAAEAFVECSAARYIDLVARAFPR